MADVVDKTRRGGRSSVRAAAVDRTVAIGVGLKISQIAQLDQFAAIRGVSRNALLREIIQQFLAEQSLLGD